jgi:DNA mismatch repair protein MSH5
VQGVYILRTVGASDFNPNNGQNKLASLDSDIFKEQSTILTAVANEMVDDEVGETDTSKKSKFMRLSTIINLDSRLSVS